MKWFNYNALVNIEPFQGSRQRCYFIPQVALVVIHIQPLRGFMQFFSRPYLNCFYNNLQLSLKTTTQFFLQKPVSVAGNQKTWFKNQTLL